MQFRRDLSEISIIPKFVSPRIVSSRFNCKSKFLNDGHSVSHWTHLRHKLSNLSVHLNCKANLYVVFVVALRSWMKLFHIQGSKWYTVQSLSAVHVHSTRASQLLRQRGGKWQTKSLAVFIDQGIQAEVKQVPLVGILGSLSEWGHFSLPCKWVGKLRGHDLAGRLAWKASCQESGRWKLVTSRISFITLQWVAFQQGRLLGSA